MTNNRTIYSFSDEESDLLAFYRLCLEELGFYERAEVRSGLPWHKFVHGEYYDAEVVIFAGPSQPLEASPRPEYRGLLSISGILDGGRGVFFLNVRPGEVAKILRLIEKRVVPS